MPTNAQGAGPTKDDQEPFPDKEATKTTRVRKKKGVAYPALLITQNSRRFYFSTIPVDDLFPSCFVSRRDDDPLTGFQRGLNESRANDIAQYLAAGSGSIPSNIVLSAQTSTGFSYSRSSKSISFSRAPFGFLVIDGQHRLWGYHKCSVQHRVPVAIYEGLTRAEEARLFIDINTTQRGVPATLLLDIKQVAEMENAREQLLRDLFDKLQSDPKSAMAGRLSASESVRGKISRVTFNRALGGALESGVLMDADPAVRYRLLSNYLNAFDAELPDKRNLAKSSYFEAIFEIFDEVVRNTISVHRSAKQSELQQIIRPLAQLDFTAGLGGKATLTKKALVGALQTTLRKALPISGDML
ncbi:DGQHR domain-containing protein [Longimicrobium terrae]|uniref:DNA sulfur modification protein DndB n=1 Tax=Longimicrobium terrae TaxID=1639882 RepID=A0A841GW54_9BACT|nr:DGQHR domain-containing protein [Longimicrobium terrae]MBB4635540.1 DNA sulfur modification protein DndB [Longimicrobium terrae]MBB6069934.1 DNA sulfur modification protein DndB [Longimicrobium terrae]NNC32847.1 DGQHR domain-containing protein [Longimicrobium terrae]